MVNKRKVVIILTEGVNDVDLLKPYIDQIVDKTKVRFEITGGDLLTKPENSRKNAKNIVGDIVSNICKKRKFRDEDILFVAHILDLDGSYIDEKDIIVVDSHDGNKKYDIENNKVVVKTDKFKDHLLNTWGRKRDRQGVLRCTNRIKNLKYYIYYNSINAEHVVADCLLEEQEDKEDCIENFVENNTLEQFTSLLADSNILLGNDYKSSWLAICNSNGFKRASNVHFLLEEIKSI